MAEYRIESSTGKMRLLEAAGGGAGTGINGGDYDWVSPAEYFRTRAMKWQQGYDAARTYEAGDVVTEGGAALVANKQTTATAAASHADWDLLGAPSAVPGQYSESGSTNVTSTTATLGLDTEDLDPDAVHSVSGSEVFITEDGYYQLAYEVVVDEDSTSGGASTTVRAWLEVDDGGGYAAIPGSESRAHVAESAAGASLGTTFLAQLEDGFKLRIRIEQNGTTDLSTAGGKSHLSLHRVHG